LSQGYAHRRERLSPARLGLFKAMDDNAELVAQFTTSSGPGALVAVGGSMGGLVALKCSTTRAFSTKLAGVYALCAPADGYGGWDKRLRPAPGVYAVCNEVTRRQAPKATSH
jgi:alpha-beta hydrolase superfamily lysophospholipase